MSKFEFSLDFDDDDASSSPVATAGTQTNKQWLEDLQKSERAATLSRKLQKYAQKRVERDVSNLALRERRGRLTATNSLDVVTEALHERSQSPISYGLRHGQGVGANTGKTLETTVSVLAARQSMLPWRPAVKSNSDMSTPTSSMSSSMFPLRNNDDANHELSRNLTSSMEFEMSPEYELAEQMEFEKEEELTARLAGLSFGDTLSSGVLPIAASTPMARKPSTTASPPRGEDDEFYDASCDFSEDVLGKLSPSSSYHAEMNRSEIQLAPHESANDNDAQQHYFHEDVLGISAVRNTNMTQSLMKVDEQEEPAYRGHTMSSRLASEKPARSSSVSPRPAQTVTFADTPSKQSTDPAFNKSSLVNGKQFGSRPLTSTPLTSGYASLRGARRVPLSAREPLRDVFTRGDQQLKLTPPTASALRSNNNVVDGKQPLTHQRSLAAAVTKPSIETPRRISVPTTNTFKMSPSPGKADLQTLEDLARQQEEALRQKVQEQQQLERKLSWHEAQSSSHSSVNSLASSKSADISSLQSAKSNRPTSRLPRPSGIPQPTARKAPGFAARGHSVVAESRVVAAVDDDECF